MIQAFFILLALIAGIPIPLAIAEPSADIEDLMRQAQEKGLANDPYWHALMHYRANAHAGDSGLLSEIISPDFFLSKRGPMDSSAELAATIAAFFQNPETDPNSHAQCRFVARYKWLRKSLDWRTAQPPPVACSQLDSWLLNGRIESLSLIFATGYLSNPASLYGHILLKFNTSRSISSTNLLDQSINFGAIVPANEIAVIYIFKGLFGGYEAGFSHDHFYRHNHMYAENELRDMWEYEISLTADEIDQIVSHSWELLGNKFVYYFLKENCAYRMAELLELVIKKPLLPSHVPWSIPASIFNHLMTLQRNGSPVVRNVRWIPSRQNRFYKKFSTLTAAQKNSAVALSAHSPNFDQHRIPVCPKRKKFPLLIRSSNIMNFVLLKTKQIPI